MKNYFAANRFVSILFSIIVILSLTIIPNKAVRAQTSDPGYSYLNSWGGDGRQLLGVHDVAVGPDGRIYIVNSDFDRVTIYDPQTNFFSELGSYGPEDGQFYRPYSVVVSDSGIVYIADGWNRRMQMFDSAGNHLKTFYQFDMNSTNSPYALALDSQQNLLLLHTFVEDIDRSGIIKFTPQGEFISEFMFPIDETLNPNKYSMRYARDLAVDSNGNIFISNYKRDDLSYPSLIKISPDYSTFSAFEIKNTTDTPGSNFEIFGVAFDSQDYLYLTSSGYYPSEQEGKESKSSLLICDSLGNITGIIGNTGTGPGEFQSPLGLTVDSAGQILVSDFNNNRLQIFDSNGDYLTAIGTPETQHGFFHYPSMVDHYNNEIYVADTNNSRIEVFNNDGSYLRTYDTSNIVLLNADDPVINPKMVRMDPFGNLFIVDFANYWIQISEHEFLSEQGTRISKVSQTGEVLASTILKMRQNQAPQGFGIDELGNVFLPISTESTIWAFNNNLEPLEGWENPALPSTAYRVDLDSDGNVLVGLRMYSPTEGEQYKLLRFDKTGQVLGINGEIDLSFTFKGFLMAPVGFSSDSAGNNYAFFSGGSLVRKYDADFNLITEFGQLNTTGYWARVARFKDIDVAEDGKVYLVDAGYHAIQVYAPTGSLPSSTTGLIQNGDFTQTSTTLQAAQQLLVSALSPQATTTDFIGLSSWTIGGLLGVSRTTETSASDGYSMRLSADSIENPGMTDAWAYQTFTIPAGTIHNQLSFNYRVFSNDLIENSDFSVLIYDGNGLEKLEELVHAGLPASGGLQVASTDLGWQSVNVNLDAYRGKSVRILLQVRNLNPTAQGIWAFVEQVQLHNEHGLYLPMITR